MWGRDRKKYKKRQEGREKEWQRDRLSIKMSPLHRFQQHPIGPLLVFSIIDPTKHRLCYRLICIQPRWEHPGSSPGIFRKRKESPWNYRLVSITGKVMEQIAGFDHRKGGGANPPGSSWKHRKDKKVTWSSQCRFMKDISCLTKKVASYDEITGCG